MILQFTCFPQGQSAYFYYLYGERRENHEVFSLVDERRSFLLSLAFNVLANSLLLAFPMVQQKYPSLQNVLSFQNCPFNALRMPLPTLHGRDVFPSADDGQRCASEVRFSPNSEYDLDPLQVPQKKPLSELQFPQIPVFPHFQRREAAFSGICTRTSDERA
nr:hypothetical protein [Ktedonobacter racemifer]